MLVSQILSTKENAGVISIGPNESITTATQLLSTHKVGALMVLNSQQELIGIISERDIVRNIGQSGTNILTLEVSKLMSKNIVTCVENETAEELMDKMTKGRFRHLPVTKENKPIAMISIGDIIKARLEELDREKQALEDYIGH